MEGPGSAPPQKLQHLLRADRRLERKERELPRAFAKASGSLALALGRVFACLANFLAEALAS